MKSNAASKSGRVLSVFRISLYLNTIFTLVGCAYLPFGSEDRVADSRYGALASVESVANIAHGTNVNDAQQRLIARDFAIVMAQIPALADSQQPLAVQAGSADNGLFAELLGTALSNKGLVISKSPGSEPIQAIEYGIGYRLREGHQQTEASVAISEYSVFFGSIGLRRAYLVDNRGVLRPDSPMMARGVNIASLVTDNSIFETADNVLAQITQPKPALLNLEDRRSSQGLALDQNSRLGLPGYNDTVNFKQLGQSNYSQLFADFSPYKEHILVFDNNSSELPAQGEQTLQKLLEGFDPRLDIVSVTGTSHGRGPYQGAQQDLAKARTATVADAIRQLGIDQRSLFAESSWSETYYDDVMPRRAAVIRVLRRRAS